MQGCGSVLPGLTGHPGMLAGGGLLEQQRVLA